MKIKELPGNGLEVRVAPCIGIYNDSAQASALNKNPTIIDTVAGISNDKLETMTTCSGTRHWAHGGEQLRKPVSLEIGERYNRVHRRVIVVIELCVDLIVDSVDADLRICTRN